MTYVRIDITATPDVPVQPDGSGGFRPDSFDDLIQQRISCPGLDKSYRHTVIDVVVAPDRNSATFTVESEAKQPLVVDRGIRVVTGVPDARVRVVDAAGSVLAAGVLHAPLTVGQAVLVGSDRYVVTGVEWPGRDPATGVCRSAVDWQHVTVSPQPQPPMVPALVEDSPAEPLATGLRSVS